MLKYYVHSHVRCLFHAFLESQIWQGHSGSNISRGKWISHSLYVQPRMTTKMKINRTDKSCNRSRAHNHSGKCIRANMSIQHVGHHLVSTGIVSQRTMLSGFWGWLPILNNYSLCDVIVSWPTVTQIGNIPIISTHMSTLSCCLHYCNVCL